MGPGQKNFTRVRSIFCGSGRVSHLWFGLEFGKFPLKRQIFQFFSTKKIALGRVRKYLGQSQVSLLFNAGQK